MPTDYAQPAVQANLTYGGQIAMPPDYPRGVMSSPPITRERFVELVALAHETVQWLESKGLKLGEQCEFRQIAERLWFAPKDAAK